MKGSSRFCSISVGVRICSSLGPAVTLEVSEYGGHVGFINHGPQRYWLEQRLMAFVQGFGFR